MELLKKCATVTLLIFVFISIGFALGKNSIKPTSAMIQPTLTGNDVAVYYLHSTFRCDTCNTIEKMTKDLLERNYTAELQTGRIVWSEVDFQEDLALAEKFEVAASCVVVAKLKDGNISSYSRLDEVWTLMEDPQAFDSYIKSAIEIALNSGDK